MKQLRKLFSRAPKLTPHEQFMKELLDSHIKWAGKGEKEYAEAYLLLLHNFTLPAEEAEAVK